MPKICLTFKGFHPVLSYFLTVQKNWDLIHKIFYNLIAFYLNANVQLRLY